MSVVGNAVKAAPHYDICILGAGIAGIIAALELSALNSDYRICLVESGAESMNAVHQSLNQGENRSRVLNEQEDPAISRVRALGGTSHQWGGYISPLDAESFEPQPGSQIGGWPISRQDLDPYYARAAHYFGVDPFFDMAHWLDQDHFLAEFAHQGMSHKIWQFQLLRFATSYREQLLESKQIDLYLETTCLGLDLDDNERIVGARCVNDGSMHSFAADVYIVSMGGLENARFLLNQRLSNPGFLRGTHANTGRYFCVHPVFTWGKVLLAGALAESKLYSRDSIKPIAGSVVAAFLQTPAGIRRQAGWQNCFFEWAWPVPDNKLDLLDSETIGHLMTRNHSLMQFAQIVTEMAPRFENHLGLTNRIDRLGQRQPYIELDLTTQEIRSAYEQMRYLGEQLGANGLGRLWLDMATIDKALHGELRLWGGHHHMCTTRMSRTPDEGVVDRNCRFHDHENLYALGSSVFASSGIANPTFTIGALAIRLADHLSAEAVPTGS